MSSTKLAILALTGTGAFAFGFSLALGLAVSSGTVEAIGNPTPAMGPAPTAPPTPLKPAIVSAERISLQDEHPRPAAALPGRNPVAGPGTQAKSVHRGG